MDEPENVQYITAAHFVCLFWIDQRIENKIVANDSFDSFKFSEFVSSVDRIYQMNSELISYLFGRLSVFQLIEFASNFQNVWNNIATIFTVEIL